MKRIRQRKHIEGATLVEVMVAAVILMALAIAGGAWIWNSKARVNIQRNKRAALECANSALESLISDPGAITAGIVSSPVNFHGAKGLTKTVDITQTDLDGGARTNVWLIRVCVQYHGSEEACLSTAVRQ